MGGPGPYGSTPAGAAHDVLISRARARD